MDQAQTQPVKVVRPFYLKGVRQEIGSVVECAKGVAAELVAMGKAAFHTEPAPSVGKEKK